MIYRSGSKNGGLVPGVALVVGGLFFAGRSALRVIEAVTEGEQRASIPLNLVFIAGALAAVYHGWTHLWMLAYEVRMPVDGSVEFVCVLRRKKLRAGEVTRIEKLVARFK